MYDALQRAGWVRTGAAQRAEWTHEWQQEMAARPLPLSDTKRAEKAVLEKEEAYTAST